MTRIQRRRGPGRKVGREENDEVVSREFQSRRPVRVVRCLGDRPVRFRRERGTCFKIRVMQRRACARREGANNAVLARKLLDVLFAIPTLDLQVKTTRKSPREYQREVWGTVGCDGWASMAQHGGQRQDKGDNIYAKGTSVSSICRLEFHNALHCS